jgi:hypothetical protein
MDQRCGSVNAYEPISDRSAKLVDFLDLIRKLSVAVD